MEREGEEGERCSFVIVVMHRSSPTMVRRHASGRITRLPDACTSPPTIIVVVNSSDLSSRRGMSLWQSSHRAATPCRRCAELLNEGRKRVGVNGVDECAVPRRAIPAHTRLTLVRRPPVGVESLSPSRVNESSSRRWSASYRHRRHHVAMLRNAFVVALRPRPPRRRVRHVRRIVNGPPPSSPSSSSSSCRWTQSGGGVDDVWRRVSERQPEREGKTHFRVVASCSLSRLTSSSSRTCVDEVWRCGVGG